MRLSSTVTVVIGLLAGCGCARSLERQPGELARELFDVQSSVDSVEPARPQRSIRIGAAEPRAIDLVRTVDLTVESLPLEEALVRLADLAGLDLVVDSALLTGLDVTLSVRDMSMSQLFDVLESLFPVRFEVDGRRVVVLQQSGPRLPVLVRELPCGLIEADRPLDFEGLEQLSFISRSQQQRSGARASPLDGRGPESLAGVPARSTLETLLDRLPELVPWPAGSTTHFDKSRNLVLVRSRAETLDLVESLLDEFSTPPAWVEIETRFVEVNEGFTRDLGVEMELLDSLALREKDGEPMVAIGSGSGTGFAVPDVVPGIASGLRFSVLGLLSEPRFRVLARAIETRDDAEVLSAPSVSTINNSRATIAITTNLPFVESFQPIFDQDIVATDGLSTTDTTVALVAEINDENFTGIVLNVTPSIGAGSNSVVLRLQPVVRTRVGEIVISEGAVVQGVATPQIARPIIETRFLDTQLAMHAGETAILGGMKTSRFVDGVTGIPFLRSLPLVGALFRRESRSREVRDLLIFVTARIRQ